MKFCLTHSSGVSATNLFRRGSKICARPSAFLIFGVYEGRLRVSMLGFSEVHIFSRA